MRVIIFILFFIPAFCYAQDYHLDIKLKDGDMIFFPDKDISGVKRVTQGHGFSFSTQIEEEKKSGKVLFPLMWIDLSDTSTFKYYTKNGKNFIYQIIDKGFGKNNALQDEDSARPLFDKNSGSIIFPEGTFLNIQVKFKGYQFDYKLEAFQANSIYFFWFIPQDYPIDKLRKTVSL